MKRNMDWAACAAAPSRLKHLAAAIIALLMLASGELRADYLNTNGAESAPNFAEVRVLEDRVRVALEIDLKDYAFFLPAVVRPEANSLNPVLLSKNPAAAFKVSIGDTVVAPIVNIAELRPRADRPMPIRIAGMPAPPTPAPRTPDVIYAEFDYPFTGQPEEITVVPPTDAGGRPTVTIGFLSWHKDIAVSDYRYLSVAETMILDWDDPWYSSFENRIITRHNTAPIMSFISIEPKEVRHEIIFRLRDLAAWGNLDLKDQPVLDAHAVAKVKQDAIELLAKSNPIEIDGMQRQPSTVRVEQVSVGLRGLNVLEFPEFTDRDTAMFGAILSYPHDDLPDQLKLTWELFSDRSVPVPVRVSDPAGGVPETATTTDPSVVWNNFLTSWSAPEPKSVVLLRGRELNVPIVSLILLGLALVTLFAAMRSSAWRRYALSAPATLLFVLSFLASGATQNLRLPITGDLRQSEASQVLDGILKNASIAMLSVDEAVFQASLDPFVPIENQKGVGAEMRRGLSVSLPSGALARTEAIDGIKVDEAESFGDGQQILASWNAYVSGGHWGHLHRRVIKYRALFDVSVKSGVWYLTGLTVLEAHTGKRDEAGGET
ncbi:hypothetical protein [Ruegeria atlantica]|uniref:Uncharacterized protein n=1 Tax=Ruegeria atlantica TaxID=81569 RepID=A0A0P1E8R5_9RHOB|nr:hypothetical protein [Ruegeria atlantica]CUH44471.1 hypothetical protein RUM4293_03373 [Ruegeria atlantica]CUH47803.1 hypothetical protein RUA4292_01979 [Ruegeria atlantica]